MKPLTRVTRACQRYDAARDERVASMRAAQEAGHSLREIAQAAGIAHVTVLKLLR